MNSIAPTSTPRVGWEAMIRPVAGELAGEDGLLLVTTGERTRPRVRVGGPDVVCPEVFAARRRMTFGKIQPHLELGGSS